MSTNKFLLTGGLGDVIAILHRRQDILTSHCPHFLLATPAHALVASFLHHILPSANVETITDFEWGEPGTPTYCFETLYEIKKHHPDIYDEYNLRQVQDLSISNVIAQSFNDHISPAFPATFNNLHHSLPALQPTIILHLNSTRAPSPLRDVTEQELVSILYFLKKHDLHGLVLNDVPGPVDNYLDAPEITYSYNLPLPEVLSLIASSHGFIGCSSWISVLSALIHPPHTTVVKGHRLLQKEFSWFYYPRHRSSPVRDNLLNLPTYHRPILPQLLNG